MRTEQLLAGSTPALDEFATARIRLVADWCLIHWARQEWWSLYETAAGLTDPEERLVLWRMLGAHSAVRSAIKEYSDRERASDPGR